MSTGGSTFSDVQRVEEHQQEQRGQGRQQEQRQQHRYPHQLPQIATKEGEGGNEEQEVEVAHIVGTTPPVLPSPQFDTSFSLESVLQSSGLGEEKNETIEKLNEEKGLLEEQLKEIQMRLAKAEKKTEEMESKRRSQMLLR